LSSSLVSKKRQRWRHQGGRTFSRTRGFSLTCFWRSTFAWAAAAVASVEVDAMANSRAKAKGWLGRGGFELLVKEEMGSALRARSKVVVVRACQAEEDGVDGRRERNLKRPRLFGLLLLAFPKMSGRPAMPVCFSGVPRVTGNREPTPKVHPGFRLPTTAS
jgi:hypothetical protein